MTYCPTDGSNAYLKRALEKNGNYDGQEDDHMLKYVRKFEITLLNVHFKTLMSLF
jgi:hypothetical protein